MERIKSKESAKKLKRSKYDDMPRSLRRGKGLFIVSMIALPVLGFLVFYVAVNLNSILMAFRKFDGYGPNGAEYSWTFEHFEHLIKSLSTESNQLRLAFRNTMLFFLLDTVIMVPLIFVISYFLFKKITGYKVFRVLFYLPNILSSMIMVVSFKNIIAVDGPISNILWNNGGEPLPSFLTNPDTAIWVILVYCFWAGMGANMILFQGGMHRIPTEVLESAALDGVTPWQELIKIILPMMWNTFSTVIILKISTIFTVSGPILLFTGGAYDTYTISYWIFDQVYGNNDFSFAAAVGLFFTAVNIPIVLLVRYLTNKVYAGIEY